MLAAAPADRHSFQGLIGESLYDEPHTRVCIEVLQGTVFTLRDTLILPILWLLVAFCRDSVQLG